MLRELRTQTVFMTTSAG